MGDVLGSPAKPNLGDQAGALATFSKSIGIMERLADAGNRAAAIRNYEKPIALGEALAKADPKDIENRRLLEDTYRQYKKAQGLH